MIMRETTCLDPVFRMASFTVVMFLSSVLLKKLKEKCIIKKSGFQECYAVTSFSIYVLTNVIMGSEWILLPPGGHDNCSAC